MKVINTRDDLINVAIRGVPTEACRRAVAEGGAINLGGFHTKGEYPGWIIQITSQDTGHKWFVKVIADETYRTYRLSWVLEPNIPWADWKGTEDGRSLQDGDVPRIAAYRRDRARGVSKPVPRVESKVS